MLIDTFHAIYFTSINKFPRSQSDRLSFYRDWIGLIAS